MDFVSLNIRTLQIFLWLRLFGLLHEFTGGETLNRLLYYFSDTSTKLHVYDGF